MAATVASPLVEAARLHTNSGGVWVHTPNRINFPYTSTSLKKERSQCLTSGILEGVESRAYLFVKRRRSKREAPHKVVRVQTQTMKNAL